ncbi:Imm3 family immunity protein [Paenibacillus durus]|uniref:Imm3 family immunity protein n=1 Tax=Paenibacillus durus TaxID=44251 RepID=UPI0006943130|nr:Imm3 family immunity protein [Paenibacillus durus]
MKKNFEEARTRIKNINWEYKVRNKPSHPVLVTEFIRSGNMFLDYNDYDPNNRRAIFSASLICKIDLPIDINGVCTELNEVKDGWAKMICTFYLEWSYLVDQEFPPALRFKDLYDPIIKLYERGGRISYHHHELVCGKYGWSRNSALILRNTPPLDIHDEILDEMDNAWYYNQRLDRDYLDNLNIEQNSPEEVAGIILERLRACNNTLGENIIIQTTLGELLLNNGILAYEHLKIIKNKLEQFKMSDLSVLLPDAEKEDLSFRIKEVLARLKEI